MKPNGLAEALDRFMEEVADTVDDGTILTTEEPPKSKDEIIRGMEEVFTYPLVVVVGRSAGDVKKKVQLMMVLGNILAEIGEVFKAKGMGFIAEAERLEKTP